MYILYYIVQRTTHRHRHIWPSVHFDRQKMDDIPVMDADVDSNGDDYNEAHSELVRFLTQSQEMRTTARGALKQSLWAAGGTFAGAILGGPIGGLVGGVTGSVLGLIKSDDYDGALLHIVNLEAEKRKKLVVEIGQILTVAGASAHHLNNAQQFRDTLCRFAEQSSVRDHIWKACLNSVRHN